MGCMGRMGRMGWGVNMLVLRAGGTICPGEKDDGGETVGEIGDWRTGYIGP